MNLDDHHLDEERPDEGGGAGASTSRDGASRGGARLLFALAPGDASAGTSAAPALKSAAAIAASMSSELHVVSVLPRPPGPSGPERVPFDIAESRRRIEECVRILRQTRVWCERVLAAPLSLRQLRIRFGDPGEQVALRAGEIDARLVILASFAGSQWPTAAAVALGSSRPVLVARDLSVSDVVIAATDLQDGQYRVLRRASELGAALRARVVAVHNASEPAALGARLPAGGMPPPELPRHMLAELPAPLDLVVTRELDPVRAILALAQQHDSRIIAVGTRQRLGRSFPRCVGSEVIERSSCSVLVTALDS